MTVPTKQPPVEACQRLGRMLERRRGELGYGFGQRARFVREHGGGRISVAAVRRIEVGERATLPETIVGLIEAMYQWSPGSVELALSGGQPNYLPVTPELPAPNPISAVDIPPTAGEPLASWIYARMRQRGHSDRAIYDFLNREGFPREPATVSAVKRIAESTGATVSEVLALLGIETLPQARSWPSPDDHDDPQGSDPQPSPA